MTRGSTDIVRPFMHDTARLTVTVAQHRLDLAYLHPPM